MRESVKRRYASPTREDQARRTRTAVLAAARRLFIQRGYAGTPVAEIAAAAGVAIDTVYAAAGRKPELFRMLIETALSGTDEAVPAAERDYVAAIRSASTASEKIRVYAHAITVIQQRVAPLYVAWREAASTDRALAAVWRSIAERRAANMRLFAQDLAATGELRDALSLDDVAAVVWSMNGSEYWLLLVGERGWAPDKFESWLVDAWQRLLLAG
ncbi:MAG: TetR family transcriptional regulator [Nocardioidaceae bacterium]|nr:TetR family transcriptional regulator [Nocardioidaceae bacterium]